MAKNRINLREDFVRSKGKLRVDRDRGVIKGVKVLGLESINGRRYTEAAIRKARPMYEGVAVYLNHPARPGDPRGVSEKFGRLVNVEVRPDGLYADLEYLKSHPDAGLVCEVAERMSEQLGCSHNAQGNGEDDADGVFVIEEIVSVRSVDLVTEPATTGGMFEGQQRRKDGKKMSRRMKRLLEDGMTADDQDLSQEAGGGNWKQNLASALGQAAGEILCDAEMSPEEKKKQLAKLVDTLADAAGEGGADDDEVEEGVRRIRKLVGTYLGEGRGGSGGVVNGITPEEFQARLFSGR